MHFSERATVRVCDVYTQSVPRKGHVVLQLLYLFLGQSPVNGPVTASDFEAIWSLQVTHVGQKEGERGAAHKVRQTNATHRLAAFALT